MIARSAIEDILGLGVHAPSGDNSQPWRFEIAGDTIEIYNLPERDNPVLNFRQRGSYIAHGALIETIVVAASKFGYAADVRAFPTPSDDTHTASVVLTGEDVRSSPLADYILHRHTNRKPYKNEPLTVEQLACLNDCCRDLFKSGTLSFSFVQDAATNRMLAEHASRVERVILEDRSLHHLLFKDVVWSQAQEKKIRSGLFIKTMELAPPQELAFWLSSHWRIMSALNRVGLSQFIAAQDAKLYATGAGMGALVLQGPQDAKDYVTVGRALQRLWLTATSLGLSLQPLAALIFAAMRLEGDVEGTFSQQHADLIASSSRAIHEHLGVPVESHVAMMFRLGQAAPPSAVCSKHPPNVRFLSS